MAVKKTTGLTFGEATSRAKAGEAVARASWSKYEMFTYIMPEHERVAKNNIEAIHFGKETPFKIKEHWVLKTIHNEMIPWNPYGTDVLANDWKVYEVKKTEDGNS